MSSCPDLIFHYSKEFEKERVESSLQKADWFRANGYTVLLPTGLKLAELDLCDISVKNLSTEAEREYDVLSYNTIQRVVEGQWSWFKDNWPEKNLSETTLTFYPEYNIYLTSYGVAGSYNQPNMVVINVKIRDVTRLATIIFHEMIHLAIEPLIQKYQISHWQKERAVDLIYKRLLPERAFEQNLPKEALSVDFAFSTYYGDVEKILMEISDKN